MVIANLESKDYGDSTLILERKDFLVDLEADESKVEFTINLRGIRFDRIILPKEQISNFKDTDVFSSIIHFISRYMSWQFEPDKRNELLKQILIGY